MNYRLLYAAAICFAIAVVGDNASRYCREGSAWQWIVERLIGRSMGLISVAFILLFLLQRLF
jgi:hypothetical protein